MVLEGKKVAFLGDSITEGTGVSDVANNRYDNVLKEHCKLRQTYNYGIGGTRLAHQSKASVYPRWDLCFCGRAYNMEKDVDLVVVYGGVNDYLHGDAPFGEIGDQTPCTFCGGVYYLMNYLKNEYVKRGIPVVFMTPAKCKLQSYNYLEVSRDANKYADAKPLLAYVEAVKETGKQLDIPVLDLYHTLPIDPINEEERQKYTSDGLHFNDAGHHVLAACLKDFLESL